MNCPTPGVKQLREEGRSIPYPCGKCYACRATRASGWSARLVEEGRQHLLSSFVTLTYNTDTVPITPHGFMSLDKTHISTFIKNLRRYEQYNLKRQGHIKYFGVGEYGSQTMRPHYHIILFGAEKESIIKTWQYGEVHLGDVTGASIGYSLKYIQKPGKIPQHSRDDRVPEYQRCSKQLGISYVNEQTKRYHKMALTERYYFPLPGGDKCALPRYYKERLYSTEQKGYLKGYFEWYIQHAEQETIRKEYQGDRIKYTQEKIAKDKHRMEQMERKAKHNQKL